MRDSCHVFSPAVLRDRYLKPRPSAERPYDATSQSRRDRRRTLSRLPVADDPPCLQLPREQYGQQTPEK